MDKQNKCGTVEETINKNQKKSIVIFTQTVEAQIKKHAIFSSSLFCHSRIKIATCCERASEHALSRIQCPLPLFSFLNKTKKCLVFLFENFSFDRNERKEKNLGNDLDSIAYLPMYF